MCIYIYMCTYIHITIYVYMCISLHICTYIMYVYIMHIYIYIIGIAEQSPALVGLSFAYPRVVLFVFKICVRPISLLTL